MPAAGEREQRFDERLLLGADGEDPFAHRPQRGGISRRIGEGDLDHGPLEREGGAQLVGRVGHELALGVERGLELRARKLVR